MRITIALFSKNGEPVLNQVLTLLKNFWVDQPLNFSVVSPTKMFAHKSADIIGKQNIDSASIVGFAYTKEAKKNYDFLSLEDTSLVFEGKIYSPIPKEALDSKLTKNPTRCEASLHALIENAEGDYSMFILNENWLAASRDPVGIQPLYYGESKDYFALSSNRKALWQLGIDKPVSFPPGNLAFINKDGLKIKPVKEFKYKDPKPISIELAAENVQLLLQKSIATRLAGIKEVAVAFSGGLDSSLVAFIANKLGVKVDLIHVSLENQPETEAALDAAEKLDLPMQVHLFKESDVESALPQVVDLIEEADPVKASIGIPFYWTAQKTSEAGYKVLLAGQGADELFGGYQRYVNEYCKEGKEKVSRTMFNDVLKIHETNLERDKKICINFDVELRLPFAALDLIDYALALPVELKFEHSVDSLRKLVLRKVALNLGLPESVVNKPKKAMQYSTGINDAVKRIAKKQNIPVNEYIYELFNKSYERYRF